jgi:hypothetical protein
LDAEIARESVIKPKTRNEGLHEMSNKNGEQFTLEKKFFELQNWYGHWTGEPIADYVGNLILTGIFFSSYSGQAIL